MDLAIVDTTLAIVDTDLAIVDIDDFSDDHIFMIIFRIFIGTGLCCKYAQLSKSLEFFLQVVNKIRIFSTSVK